MHNDLLERCGNRDGAVVYKREVKCDGLSVDAAEWCQMPVLYEGACTSTRSTLPFSDLVHGHPNARWPLLVPVFPLTVYRII